MRVQRPEPGVVVAPGSEPSCPPGQHDWTLKTVGGDIRGDGYRCRRCNSWRYVDEAIVAHPERFHDGDEAK